MAERTQTGSSESTQSKQTKKIETPRKERYYSFSTIELGQRCIIYFSSVHTRMCIQDAIKKEEKNNNKLFLTRTKTREPNGSGAIYVYRWG